MFKIIKFVFFGICPSMASLFGVNQKPNIVVFISDDLGRLDTSIHGSKDARTPTIERLAAEGMTFDDAYVASPSCCPSRFSLLTGLMPARHGAPWISSAAVGDAHGITANLERGQKA